MGIMSLSEILDKSFDILRKHMKSIALFSLCYGVVYTVGMSFLVVGGGVTIALSAVTMENAVLPIIILSFTFVFALVLILASRAGIIKIASQEFSGERAGFGEAMAASFKSLHKILVIFIIELLLFIPVLLVFGVIGYFIYIGLDTKIATTASLGAEGVILIILFILVMLVLLISILMYYTWFSFSLHLAVIEKRGPIASMKRSFKLVRRNFWRIFGTMILIGFTIYAIQSSIASFVSIILSLLFLLIKILNLPVDFLTFFQMTYNLASFPIGIISWLIITPASTIMTTLLYYNQRFKKEGYDMVIRLREIQKNEERKQRSELV